jgi:hypothetical protein
MNRMMTLAFLDEMSKIAEAITCKGCGKKKDLRMGYCFDCVTKKEKTSGFMANLGGRITSTIAGMGANAGNALQQFYTHPVQALGKGLKATVSGHPAQTALYAGMLGLGVHDLAKKVDPTGGGRSRLHRTSEFVGDQVGSLIGTPFGFTGQLAGGMTGKKIGDLAGKGIDKVRGYKRTPAMVQEAPAAAESMRAAS